MQLQPALDLLHNGPVRQGVQVPERRPTVHGVLLLVPVQEQGPAYAVPPHG